MKKVLFLAYNFPPIGWSGVQRSLKFVKYLRDFNWEPIVVTVKNSSFCMKDESLLKEIPEGLKIIRIEEFNSNYYKDKIVNEIENFISPVTTILSNDHCIFYKNYINQNFNSIKTLLSLPDDEVLWSKKVLDEIDSLVDFNKIDLIYSTSYPYSTHFIGYSLKQKYNIPWVTDFRDEWTNDPSYNFDKNNVFFKVQKEMESKILNYCDKIITISPIAKENYINTFNINPSKIHVITNGYDESDFLNLPSNNKNDKFTIIYNGSLYLERNPNIILKSINSLIDKFIIDKNKIEIKFIGTCTPDIYKTIFENNKYNIIKYIQYLPHIQSLKETSKANLLLLLIGKNPRLKSVYTGKIFEYLRLKKPILSISPKNSVVEHLLFSTNCGKNFEYDDIYNITNYIKNLYDKWNNNDSKFNRKEEEIKKFNRKFLTQNLSNIFNSLI